MDKNITAAIVFTIIVLSGLAGILEAKICWDSTWYNNSSPTNRSEYESLPKKSLDAICTTGPAITAQCKDNRGEPFTAHKVDKFNEYEATCDVTHGLECHPFTNSTKTCPDFAIQYGCACPSNLTRTASTPGKTESHSTNTVGGGGVSAGPTAAAHTGNSPAPSTGTSGSGGNNSRQQKGRNRNGATSGQPCILVLTLCLVIKHALSGRVR